MDRLNIIYVMQTTELCGGHKIIFEHANRLTERGHSVAIYALSNNNNWFSLKAPIVTFKDYDEMILALLSNDFIKIATFHKTAPVVVKGLGKSKGFYLVQDIETSFYYDLELKNMVLKTYEMPLQLLCEGNWVEEELKKYRLNKNQPINIGIAVSESFGRQRHCPNFNQLLYLDRNMPFKDKSYFIKMLDHLPYKKFDLITVGSGNPYFYETVNHTHLSNITENEMIDLYNDSLCYINTSLHEGFCLPALEAMTCGCPVVCRDSEGNREHCNYETSLICDSPKQMAESIILLQKDHKYRNDLIENGYKMASNYNWDKVIDNLITALKGNSDE